MAYENIQQDMTSIVVQWMKTGYLRRDELFVVGCSTSEVAGKHIGTSGSEQIAAVIFKALQVLQQQTGIHLVFQCCEHLNRALVVEREAATAYQLEEVSVIPIPAAGGSMASYA